MAAALFAKIQNTNTKYKIQIQKVIILKQRCPMVVTWQQSCPIVADEKILPLRPMRAWASKLALVSKWLPRRVAPGKTYFSTCYHLYLNHIFISISLWWPIMSCPGKTWLYEAVLRLGFLLSVGPSGFLRWALKCENVKVWRESVKGNCERERVNMKVWKGKCERESVREKVWKWRCEREGVKGKVWKECVKVWKGNCTVWNL